MKKILVLAVAMATIITFTGCDVKFGVKEKNHQKAEAISIDEKVKYNGEDNIDIDLDYGEINISNYDGDEVLVTGKSYENINDIKVKSGFNKIKIKDKGLGEKGINLIKNNKDIDSNIEIKIPNSFKGNINLDYGTGDVLVNNLTCKELKIDGGVGTANVNLSEAVDNIDIDGGVGDISLVLEKIGGDLKCDGGVGSVNIKVPENAPIYFDTDTGVGSVNLNAKTSGEKLYKFSLDAGVGDITVTN